MDITARELIEEIVNSAESTADQGSKFERMSR